MGLLQNRLLYGYKKNNKNYKVILTTDTRESYQLTLSTFKTQAIKIEVLNKFVENQGRGTGSICICFVGIKSQNMSRGKINFEIFCRQK